MKNLYSTFLLFCLFGCSYEKKIETETSKKEVSKTVSIKKEEKKRKFERNKIETIDDLKKERIFFFNTQTYLIFDESKVALVFEWNQCDKEFKTTTSEDVVEIYWNPELNCKSGRKINQTFNLSSYPRNGDKFAEVRILNDSTIFLNYKFKKWVSMYNEFSQKNYSRGAPEYDTAFPTVMYVANRYYVLNE